MAKLHIYLICIIIGQAITAPFVQQMERKRREIDIEADGNSGLVSRDEENVNEPREIIFEIITRDINSAQTKDIFVIDEIVNERDLEDDDMELAETHIFRPLFRYRAQLEKRKRLGQKK